MSIPSVDCLVQCNQDTILDSQYLVLLCDVLEKAITIHQEHVVLCVLTALQSLLRVASMVGDHLEDSGMKQLKTVIWKLVAARADTVSSNIQKEACRVLCAGLDVFYPDTSERNALLAMLLAEVDGSTGLVVVRDLLLCELATRLNDDGLHDSNRDIGRLRYFGC